MAIEQLVYTDRPRGKGVDPNAAGYQIAACSPGLGADVRGVLGSICMHYGDAVYRHAPRTAIDGETAWRTRTDTITAVPAEVLDAFPIVWIYDRINDSLVSLTRVRYSGFTHDGRTGNFFAHALVFDPRDLASHGYSPLALTQSELFLESYPGDGTSLPAASDPGDLARGAALPELLAQPPYRERLPALVHALAHAEPSARPVLLCLDDWRKAVPVVDALLGLLPPSGRSQTTFCTYESDHKWLGAAGPGPRPRERLAAHHLVVLCSQDAGTCELRPDEYRSGFRIFNFVQDQFSDVGAPGPFATFVASCVSNRAADTLQNHHDLAEALGVGSQPAAWDTLVPSAGLRSVSLRGEELVAAARALAALATDAKQAGVALRALWPHLRGLSASLHEAGEARSVGAEVAALIDRTDPELRRQFAAELVDLATAAFAEGRTRAAAVLLEACGGTREKGVLSVLSDAVRVPIVRPAAVEDQRQAVELLLEGLRLCEKSPEAGPPIAALLPLTFRSASDAGRGADVWQRVGERFVKPLLSGDWSDAKARLLEELIQALPADRCPDGSYWLNLRLLDGAKPAGAALTARFEELARASGACQDADRLAQDLLRLVNEHFTEPEPRGEVLGRMAEASLDGPSGQRFFAAYTQIKAQDADLDRQLRKKLAKAGVSRVLCREMLGEVLPWTDESDSSRKFDAWWDPILKYHPAVVKTLCRASAGRLERSSDTGGCLALARAILSKVKDELRADPDCLVLANAAARALPFAPLAAAWQHVFRQTPGLSADADARVKLFKFMGEVEAQAESPTWAVEQFRHDDPRWRSVAALGTDDRAAAVRWCVTAFDRIGIASPQQAEAFARVLEAAGAGSQEEIGSAAARLADGRDPVTWVLLLMAFARCTLEGQGPPSESVGGRVVGAILRRCERGVQSLFEAHLQQRFARRTIEYDRRLETLCEQAGVARPGRTPTPGDKPPGPPAAGQAPSDTLADRAKGFLGRLLGRADEAQKDGTTEDRRSGRADRHR